MKKMPVFILLLLILPMTIAELTNEDLKKVEAVVRREVDQSNKKLKDDLYSDIDSMRSELSGMVEQITMSTTGIKLIMVLSLAGIIIVAESGISFLRYMVRRKQKTLPQLKEEIAEAKQILIKQNKEIDTAIKEKTKLLNELKKVNKINSKKKNKDGNTK